MYATSASTACCGEVVGSTIVRDVAVATEPPDRRHPRSAPRSTRREQAPVRSEPAEEESIPSNVPELPAREADAGQAGDAAGAQPAAEPRRPRVIASSRPPPRKFLGVSSRPSGRPLPPRAPPRRPLLARARPAEREQEPGRPRSPRAQTRPASHPLRLRTCRRSPPPKAKIFSPPRKNGPLREPAASGGIPEARPDHASNSPARAPQRPLRQGQGATNQRARGRRARHALEPAEHLRRPRGPDRRLRPVRRPGPRRRLDRKRDHAQRPGLLRQPDHRQQRPDHRRRSAATSPAW